VAAQRTWGIRDDVSPETIVCRCNFTLADVSDVWASHIGEEDAGLPGHVLERFLSSVGVVEDAMCERGYEAIDTVLGAIAAEAIKRS
jgi:hypothetical protein